MKCAFKKKVAMLVMTALMGTLAVPAMAAETTTNTAGQLNSLEAAEAGYLGAINRYRDARDMGYSEASIYGNDVNYILERAQPPSLYYTLVDLAQDGVPELFIGYSDFMGVQVNASGWREGDYEFYDIFGYENGYVMRLFPTGMGIDERFHLMNGGVLMNTITGGADALVGFYTLGANSATPYLSKFVEYDGRYGDYYYLGSGSYNDTNKKQITAAQWNQTIRSYDYTRHFNWYPIDNTAALHQALRSFSIPVYVNNSELACDQPAVARNGRTFVPLRAIFEALGATVEWNGVNQTITAVKGNTTVRMRLNGTTMSKNGQLISLDVPPQALGGRTMVPVRAIADAFNYNVSWDSVNRIVSING